MLRRDFEIFFLGTAMTISTTGRRQRSRLCERVVGGCNPQRVEIGKAFEYRADGVSRAFGDLRRQRRGAAFQRRNGHVVPVSGTGTAGKV